ncbi:MAG: glycosyltransferase [Bacilli bacterium]|nr:glycosyltransferase [Bacilli bacterium]
MKIVVYAISKNESKFVNRWYESMKEADEIIVLDTGSTDDTKEKLEKLGVKVSQTIIEPFRFDTARNLALDLVPDDATLCISTDLDEVFETGWRELLEKNYHGETRISYTYNWHIDDNGNPDISFHADKIHTKKDYKWTHPVHEVLTNINNNETRKLIPELVINHYPDSNKSRSNYLNLLELSVLEDPEDDRNMHYLGREYMYYNRYQEAIDTLTRHLSLKKATWKDERCASMRFIARCYKNLKRFDESIMWYEKAIQEAPYLRDPYVELAMLYYEKEDYDKVYLYLKQALKITNHKKTYINELFSWNETPYDLLSIACYYKGLLPESLYYIDEALKLNSSNERINKNKEIIESILKEK